MKLLVISDSHGIDQELAQLLAAYRDQVDYILHCGDSELPSADPIWSLTDAVVKGNMDFDYGYELFQSLKTVEGKLLLTHGHTVGVNFSREELAQRAKEVGANLAFYGHTHVLGVEKINGVICLNPGSFNHSRGPVRERTYALVEVMADRVKVDFHKYDKSLLPQLSQELER